MRKIMFVCQSLGNGGAERVVSILSDALAQKKYEICILALSSNDRAYEIDEQIKVLLPTKKPKKGVIGKFQRIKIIRSAIKENKIDVIIAFSHYNAMFSVIAAQGMNVKIIGSERNDPAQIKERKITNALRNILYRKLDCLVCQTDDAKAYFPKAIQKKSVVILNPVSESLPAPYIGERTKRIVTFCRLEAQKNIPMLVDAFEMLSMSHPEYVLDIYGDGSEKEHILTYIREKKLENKVTVKSFARDIHKQVLDAAMFVLPSNYEGLSNSMLEAMSIGLPTIVTDCPCGGARMVIVDGENGLLVPVGDSNALYIKMKYLIDYPDVAEKISSAGALLKTKLAKDEICRQWLSIL